MKGKIQMITDLDEKEWPRLRQVVAQQPYPLVVATISGSHLYGFASPNSDYDIRGVHVIGARDLFGLQESKETIDFQRQHDGAQMDLVSHDIRKFFKLLLGRNGNALECLFSPLVIQTGQIHDEMKDVAKQCLCTAYAYHYIGFAFRQWTLFCKESPKQVKSLLYVFRVLLTGLHLMRTGEVEANIWRLQDACKLEYPVPFLNDLIAQKQAEDERAILQDIDMSILEKQYQALSQALREASMVSHLPLKAPPEAVQALNSLLIRTRLASLGML